MPRVGKIHRVYLEFAYKYQQCGTLKAFIQLLDLPFTTKKWILLGCFTYFRLEKISLFLGYILKF